MALTISEPIVNDTDRLNITQAAAVLGIHRNTLRQHSDEGLIKFSVSKRTGYRKYLGRDIKRYWRMQA
jgi:DNA-binding transcriptional MerR regulator